MIRDSYFTILIEVFVKHNVAYFTKHSEKRNFSQIFLGKFFYTDLKS